jgi:hypothetical protein
LNRLPWADGGRQPSAGAERLPFTILIVTTGARCTCPCKSSVPSSGNHRHRPPGSSGLLRKRADLAIMDIRAQLPGIVC